MFRDDFCSPLFYICFSSIFFYIAFGVDNLEIRVLLSACEFVVNIYDNLAILIFNSHV